jgi:hypothetical protein
LLPDLQPDLLPDLLLDLQPDLLIDRLPVRRVRACGPVRIRPRTKKIL